jgi:choline dehydrogenase-like flavoprotein
MLLDFRSVESGAKLETDVGIIGAGAAGITIALELMKSRIGVYLLESGGFNNDLSTQSLYKGESIGLPYYPLENTRLRFFGGSTNHWTGLCAPLTEIDFEARPWVPYSGWPISRADLEPYYARAQPVLNLGPYFYDERIWKLLRVAPLQFNPDKIRTTFWQFSNPIARLGQKYKAALEQADRVRLLVNGNVINIQTNKTGSTVQFVDIATLEGKRARLWAKRFILACGGLENPRLLLVSNRVEQAGIGNRQGLVGRFFTEHLHGDIGELVSDDYARLLNIYLKKTQDGQSYLPALQLGTVTQRMERVLNSAVEIQEVTKLDSGWQTAKNLYEKIRQGQKIDDLPSAIWRIVKDFDQIASNAYRRFVLGKFIPPPTERIKFFSFAEQSPNPDSRVTLSDQKDALGINRIKLDWRLSDLDRYSIATLVKTLAAEFGRLNSGRVRAHNWVLADSADWGKNIWGGNHHMGTTRMADSPQFGVVDKNCRVHGVANLYVAGSSVFVTGGYANPTLTVIALALRLADHVKSQFG